MGQPGCGDALPILCEEPRAGYRAMSGHAVLRMLANVQQTTIKPTIAAAVAPGTLVHESMQTSGG